MMLKNYDERISASEQNWRTKMLVDFNHPLACSLKYLAANKSNEIKPTSRFFDGKMLMLAKLSLMSFINECH